MPGFQERQPFTFIIEGPEDHPDKNNTQDLSRGEGDPFNNELIHHDGLDPHPNSMTLPHLDEEDGFMPTKSIIDNLLALKQFEEQRKFSLIDKTDLSWDLYHNRYDFSHKEEWQAQISTPKFSVAVERIVSAVMRLLEDSSDWFDIEATEEESEIYFNLVESLIKKFLDTQDLRFRKFFKEAVKVLALSSHVFVHVSPYSKGYKTLEAPEPEDFNLFSTGLEEPGLEALIGRPVPTTQDEEDPTLVLPGRDTFRIDLEVLNTDYCYKDSRNRGLYTVHEAYYSVGEMKLEARERGWDMAKVDASVLQGDPGNSRLGRDGISHEVRDAEKQDVNPAEHYGKEAKITYFYGTLLDETTGDVIIEESFLIMLNDTEIVYGPEPLNKVFWGGVVPVVDSPFVPVPHAAYGKSPLVDAAPLFVAYNEFYNLMYDYYKGVILGIKEVDMDMIDHSEFDITDGLFPGQVIPVDKSSNPTGQAVKNVEFTDPPAGFFNFIQMFEKDLQDNIALSDTISGGARTRGRITALEHQRRAADAGALIESLYETLEENLLVQVIYKTFYTILQFMPDKEWKDFVETRKRSIAPKDPNRQEQWEELFEDLKTWTPKRRWKELAGKFKFKVRVFSALADRQMQIEKATFLMQTASANPAYDQHILHYRMLRYIVTTFGWNAEDILSAEALPLPNQSQGQETGVEGETGDSPSLGQPTSLSTGPPGFAPTAGVPGVRNEGAIADNNLG